MGIPWRTALAVAALAACSTRATRAQTDYRNLDDDRPVLVEDAYPVERYAFELLAPYRLERGRNGSTLHAFVPELAFGILRNAQLGFKVPLVAERTAGATSWGVSGLRVFGLYNFNTESRMLPALSLRSDGYFPVGSAGGDVTRGEIKLIATRSWGHSRVHVNGAYGFGTDGVSAAVESASRWWYGVAVDRTLFRQSTLLVAEVTVRRPSDGVPTEVAASIGLRRQWTPTTVVDLGIRRRLSDTGPEIGFTFGLSHAFAVAGLMPRGTPSIPAGESHEHHH